MIKTVLENMDGQRMIKEVSGQLLIVEERGNNRRSSSATGAKSHAFAASTAKTPWDKRRSGATTVKRRGK